MKKLNHIPVCWLCSKEASYIVEDSPLCDAHASAFRGTSHCFSQQEVPVPDVECGPEYKNINIRLLEAGMWKLTKFDQPDIIQIEDGNESIEFPATSILPLLNALHALDAQVWIRRKLRNLLQDQP